MEQTITSHNGISICTRVEVPEPQSHEQIAALAYQFWQDRGCPEGTPDEDWFRAERELFGLQRILDEKDIGSRQPTEQSITSEETDPPVLRFPVRSEICQTYHASASRTACPGPCRRWR